MKKTSRILTASAVVIWAPVIYGWAHYPELPVRMVTHWGFNNQPNGWMPRALAVYGLPLLMTVLQVIMVSVMRFTTKQKGAAPRFERVMYALMPVLSVVLYVATIQANMGGNVDIRRIAMILIAMMFIVMGNYMPTVPAGFNRTFNGFHKAAANPRTWPKVARAMGYTMVAGGLLMFASLFTPPMGSTLALAIAIVALLSVSWWGYRLSVRTN